MIRIALAGDVMLGRLVDRALCSMSPEEPWGDVLPLLKEADLRIVNLECAVTAHERPWSRSFKVFHFRAGPHAVAPLRAAGIDACSLANNHTLDFEEVGLTDTLAHLDGAGIRHAGAGRDVEEARRPALLPTPGGRVALLSCTDNEPLFAAGPDRPGTHYLPVSLSSDVLAEVAEAVRAARAQGADTVIFSNHWGPNMVERPGALFRQFAHAVIDRGADIYHGHSAHLCQGVEVYRGKPILYDTGDFLDDYAVDEELHNDWSFLFRISIREPGSALAEVELIPVVLSLAHVSVATGELREAILERMEGLSSELGTSFARQDGRLVLRPESLEAAGPTLIE
jgi:poly-gamma-glutamate synthesis protein (capsule biosynthesis protein)